MCQKERESVCVSPVLAAVTRYVSSAVISVGVPEISPGYQGHHWVIIRGLSEGVYQGDHDITLNSW